MIKILVNSFMVITLFLSLPLNAQPQKPLKPKNVQMAMIDATLSEIQTALSLTEEQMAILRPAYILYQKRVTRLNADNNRQFNRVRVDTQTDEQAEKLLKESITRSRQIIAAKEKFNASISTLLTPRQIMRIHQIDSSFRHRIRDIYDARRPGLKGKDNIKHK